MRNGGVDLVLKLMLDGTPRKRSEVAGALGLEPRAASNTLDTMKRLGYLERTEHGYKLTPEGIERAFWVPVRLRSAEEKRQIRKTWKVKAPVKKVEPKPIMDGLVSFAIKRRHVLEVAWGSASA